jgi:predicted P-loop ATPase
MTKTTIRDEAESMATSGEWEAATPDHFVALYGLLFHRCFKVNSAERGVRRRVVEALASYFNGSNVDLAAFMRWAFERAIADERAGKSRELNAAILFSGAKVTDYRVQLARAGELPEEDDDAPKDAPAWVAKLAATKDGTPRSATANVITILSRDEAWRGVLALDEFAGDIVTRRPPPWHADDAPAVVEIGDWTDEDVTRLCAYLSRAYKLEIGSAKAREAAAVVAQRTRFHPVREYLRSVAWDGEPRIDTWLIDFCEVEDSPYSRAVASKFLISAVARIETPGSKVDTMPILKGEQGARKSTAVRALFGDAWTLETQGDLGTKDAYQALRRKWGVELAELDAFSRSEASRAKAFITVTRDTYRPSYGRATRDFPRQCVFVGSTNAETYLKDETGARRYWPVDVGQIDVPALLAVRDQLWAEARARFVQGEAWHIEDADPERAFKREQEARFQADPWESAIDEWLTDMTHGAQRHRLGVTTAEIMRGALHIEPARMTRADEMRVGAVLGRLRWERRRLRAGTSRSYLYKPAAAQADAKSGDGGGMVGSSKGRKKRLRSSVSSPSLPNTHTHKGKDQGQGSAVAFPETRSQVGPVGTDDRPTLSRSEAMRLRLVRGGGS